MSAQIVPIRGRERLMAGPSNIEAEQAVLGAALVNEGVLRACEFLSVDDFYEPVHGRVWTAMRRALSEGRPATPVALRVEFDTDGSLKELDGGAYLSVLARKAERIIDAVGYAREVARLARLRRVADIAEELAETAREPGAVPAGELVAEAVGRLEKAGLDGARRLGRTLAEIAEELAADLLTAPDTFSTGIAPLDRAIGGSVPFGYVVGLEARPAGGKTLALHTIALNAARKGVPTVYFAAEMGAKRLSERILGHLGNFESQWFRHRDPQIVSALERVQGRMPDCLVLEDCAGVAFGRLRQMAAEHLRRRKCRLFILDYYQLVQPDGRPESKVQHLEEVANWLAKFAYDHGVTWLVASQQNRDGYTLAGDGLLRACDWLAQIIKIEEKVPVTGAGLVEPVWLDVRKARDGSCDPVGSAEKPRLFIDPRGPHLAELPT